MKRFKFFIWNFIITQSALFAFNYVYLFGFGIFYFWLSNGFWWYLGLIFEIIYFFFWVWKNYKYQRNLYRYIEFIHQSPLSIVVGKLGTGKTLLLAHSLVVMKLWAEYVYSNFPNEIKKTKVITFKNLDFSDTKKPVPPNNSFIAFDESYLYIDGTNPKDTKLIHSGKIPWILLARHFAHNAMFAAQRPNQIWNEIRELATAMIIPLSLKKPPKHRSLFPRFFIMEIGVFQDMDTYEIWKSKSTERIADGKKSKRKSDSSLGINFFKIVIPISTANSYNSTWLSFVRDIKNDKIDNIKDVEWSEISKLTDRQKLDLFDIDILKKNLGGKK